MRGPQQFPNYSLNSKLPKQDSPNNENEKQGYNRRRLTLNLR